MYAIELLRMIQKFEEKYPDIDLSNRGFRVEFENESGWLIHFVSSYKIGLKYIKFKTEKYYDNKIRIPELKSILEKYNYKKIYIEIESEILYEIPNFVILSNLIYNNKMTLTRLREWSYYITREEIL